MQGHPFVLRRLRIDCLPLILDRSNDIQLLIAAELFIAVEMPEGEVRYVVTGIGKRHERAPAAIGHEPSVTARKKYVRSSVAHEVADEEVFHPPLAVVNLFPRRNSAP